MKCTHYKIITRSKILFDKCTAFRNYFSIATLSTLPATKERRFHANPLPKNSIVYSICTRSHESTITCTPNSSPRSPVINKTRPTTEPKQQIIQNKTSAATTGSHRFPFNGRGHEIEYVMAGTGGAAAICRKKEPRRGRKSPGQSANTNNFVAVTASKNGGASEGGTRKDPPSPVRNVATLYYALAENCGIAFSVVTYSRWETGHVTVTAQVGRKSGSNGERGKQKIKRRRKRKGGGQTQSWN